MEGRMMRPEDPSTIQLLGARMNPLKERELIQLFIDTIASKKRKVFAHQNLHGIYMYHHDAKMRRLLDMADYVYIDGMSVILLGRLLRLPLQRAQRTTGLDFVFPLLEEAATRGWRVYFLGSKPNIGETAAGPLRKRFPGLCMKTTHGYFDCTVDSVENLAVIRNINDFRPDLLIVGMGMPKQEHWVLDNVNSLDVNAILCAGGLMDYIAGSVQTPPRWLSRIGLEGGFRLASEPRRLWKRYLLEPWFIALMLLLTLLKQSQQHVRSSRRNA